MPKVFMRHSLLNMLLISLLLIRLTPAASAPTASNGVIAVVINQTKTIKQLKLHPENLNPIFWRKQRYWPKGLPIKPVNLDPQHPLRAAFSQTILGSLPSAQIDYWNGQYFNGIKPPYSVKSEEAVLRYVAKTKGAIGYVDACHLDDRVQAVFWIINQTITPIRPTQLNCH